MGGQTGKAFLVSLATFREGIHVNQEGQCGKAGTRLKPRRLSGAGCREWLDKVFEHVPDRSRRSVVFDEFAKVFFILPFILGHPCLAIQTLKDVFKEVGTMNG
jgi:hypothetical protein